MFLQHQNQRIRMISDKSCGEEMFEFIIKSLSSVCRPGKPENQEAYINKRLHFLSFLPHCFLREKKQRFSFV